MEGPVALFMRPRLGGVCTALGPSNRENSLVSLGSLCKIWQHCHRFFTLAVLILNLIVVILLPLTVLESLLSPHWMYLPPDPQNSLKLAEFVVPLIFLGVI